MSHWCAENAFKCIKSTCHIQKHTQTLFFSIYCLLLSFVQNACRNIYLVAVAEARACLLISNNYIFFLVFFLSEDSIQFGLGFPFWRFHCTFIRLLTLHLLHLYGCKLCLFPRYCISISGYFWKNVFYSPVGKIRFSQRPYCRAVIFRWSYS